MTCTHDEVVGQVKQTLETTFNWSDVANGWLIHPNTNSPTQIKYDESIYYCVDCKKRVSWDHMMIRQKGE